MSGYIGTQPVPQATQTRDSFTATSGQTSFATGGYTPNFLDVYLNGVKLAAADYTASNGSDVVLASGAATGDILEVVAFTTFNSASSSIDDNGNATAITIDSSENVLIGTTDSTPYDNTSGNGILLGDGLISSAQEGGNTAIFNRMTSDGSIVQFRKDGTTVGSIGNDSGNIKLDSAGGTGLLSTGGSIRYSWDADQFYPAVDNNKNLGVPSYRFKDAYLSGGVYLGGTGSANLLDSYEEGTWNPSSAYGTITAAHANYVKVGRLVTLAANIYSFSDRTTNGAIAITGVPFASSSASRTAGGAMVRNTDNTAITASYLTGSGTAVEFYGVHSGAFDPLKHNDLNNSSSEVYFTISYYTDA